MFLKQHFANSEHFYKSTLVEGKPVIWLQSVQEELKSQKKQSQLRWKFQLWGTDELPCHPYL